MTASVGEETASATRNDADTTLVITSLRQQGLLFDKQVDEDKETSTKDCQWGALKDIVGGSIADCEDGAANIVSGECVADCPARSLISVCESELLVEHRQTASSFLFTSEVLKHKESADNISNDNTVTSMKSKTFPRSNSVDKLVLNRTTTLESYTTNPPDCRSNSAMSSSVEGLAAEDKSAVSGRVISAKPPLASVSSPFVRKESSGSKIGQSGPEERSARQPLEKSSNNAMENLMRGGAGSILHGSSATGSLDFTPNIETHQRSASSPAGLELSHQLPPPKDLEMRTPVPVEQWSVEDVCRWLAGLGWREDVRRRFEAQQVTGEVLLTLTEHDFKEELDLRVSGFTARPSY